MTEVVIVAATRTAIGRFQGSLSSISASDLGAHLIKHLLDSTQLSAECIDEVIIGQVLTAGCGQNPARQAAINGGLNQHTPALTINKVCGSGLKAIHLASQAIACGDADIVIAGGQENMSQSPHLLAHSRQGMKLGNQSLIDSMVHDGLWDAFHHYHMGITAENLAEKYQITRRQQDEFALKSIEKAKHAIETGKFVNEICPIALPNKKGDPLIFNIDEQPRFDTTLNSLESLRPAFDKNGTVTAGNASTLNDGAAMLLLMSKEKASSMKLPILAKIKSYASSGVDPSIMGIGPVTATQQCLQKANWHLNELDVIEANEAFAAQALSVNKELGWDTNKINVNGGAIALGHPIGASGARITVSLIHEMLRQDAHKGLATLCIGGGQGIALALER